MIVLASSLLVQGLLYASPQNLGPMPHERTNTPKKSNANVGRYLYVGVAPKFDGGEVDLTVSKMSLTLRATGWISKAKIDGYAGQLYKRWEQIDSTLDDPNFVLHPLVKLENIPRRDTSIAWAKIAGQYSSHVLENRGVEIYNSKRNANSLAAAGKVDNYRNAISTAILRYFFRDNSLNVDLIKSDNMLRDSLLSVENSRKLFKTHYQSIFTPSNTKPGYLGHLTF